MAQDVEVEVVDIRAGGVLVTILEDGRTGFIRRRELSWERRIAFREEAPKSGQRFTAKIIQESADDRYPQLSVCQLTDPWQNARSKYAINDIVRGEVVNIRDFGVFVQIEPGVDALVRSRYLPLLRDQFPQDVLAIGDQVQGVLIKINWTERQIELSLTHRLVQVSQDIGDGQFPQFALFQDRVKAWGRETVVKPPTTDTPNSKAAPRRYHPPLPRLKRVLIVDDNPIDRQRIVQMLHQERSLVLVEAASGDEAQAKIIEEPTYDLIIVDLTLQDEDGVDAARKLLDKQPDLPILFTSNDPLVDERRFFLHSCKYPFAVKEREELLAWIDKLYGGYWEESPRTNSALAGEEVGFMRQLGIITLARRPLPEVLAYLLSQLRQETGITQAIVMAVDVAKESATILAMDPLLEDDLLYGTDALYHSPVQEVVVNNAVDYRQYLPTERPPSLKNFFPLLDYQTCLGIPLTVPGMPTCHALFVLDEYRPSLSKSVKEQTYLTAHFIQIALERALLLDFMQRYEQRYTLGQLLGSLIHELSNKLDTLAGADNLSIQLQGAEKATEADEQVHWLQKGQETAVRLARAKQDLQDLVLSYSRLASGNFEAVDVHQVILKIVRQLDKKAREARVQLFVAKTPDLPSARAVQPRLEQVVTNIILNAIQQIERQRRQMADVAVERNKLPLCQQGVVRIQTRYHKGTAYPLEIIVMDSGPGIAAHRQEEIFLLDTSGREKGHGLGLYISRNLMETMGGRLSVVDSVMFLGSAFVIALSKFPIEGD